MCLGTEARPIQRLRVEVVGQQGRCLLLSPVEQAIKMRVRNVEHRIIHERTRPSGPAVADSLCRINMIFLTLLRSMKTLLPPDWSLMSEIRKIC